MPPPIPPYGPIIWNKLILLIPGTLGLLVNSSFWGQSSLNTKLSISPSKQGFQQEITLNTNKIDQLIVFGEQLIQKSEPLDAVLIEDELEELHRYCQEVFGRVSRFHRRLTSHTPVRTHRPGLPAAQWEHRTGCLKGQDGYLVLDPWFTYG